jgi:uncharacterized protein
MTLDVFRCTACGTTLFPARYRCPACGGAQWATLAAASGKVVAATTVTHRVGAAGAGEVHLASVETDAGPTIIARLESAAHEGDTVSLDIDDEHRIVARTRSASNPQVR